MMKPKADKELAMVELQQARCATPTLQDCR